jgi:hypothetical protein
MKYITWFNRSKIKESKIEKLTETIGKSGTIESKKK